MPLVFLSHSGRNTTAALELRRKLLDTPAARAAELKVWLDKTDLVPGVPWKDQIEQVISKEATCFVLLADPGGVRTWVAAETDAALSRAVADDSFRFIPILFDGGSSSDLSPFVRRYHAIRNDPLNDESALEDLLSAVLNRTSDAGHMVLTDEPFPGLRAMDEGWADRFFGRSEETAEVIRQLQANPMLVIAADSGTGKS